MLSPRTVAATNGCEFNLSGISEHTVKMQSSKLEQLISANAPLQNPDGTENQDAVTAINDLGAQLARQFSRPQTGAKRRKTFRRVRRRGTARTR
jgi:hypothetical protein